MLGCIGILEKHLQYIYQEWKHLCIVLKIWYKKFPPIKIKFLLKKKMLGSLAYDTCIKKNSYN